jgi:hypothetical protein
MDKILILPQVIRLSFYWKAANLLSYASVLVATESSLTYMMVAGLTQ